jgi:uncharacterized protein (TIGR02594 family)
MSFWSNLFKFVFMNQPVERLFPEIPKEVSVKSNPTVPWIELLKPYIGLNEVQNNKELSKYLKSDGGTVGDPAKYAWCGDLVHTAIRNALPNEKFTSILKENPYWARNWSTFGIKAPYYCYGMIAVFKRGTGGHVGFVVGYDPVNKLFKVLGGNQSNEISYTFIDSRTVSEGGRLMSLRYPASYALPQKANLPIVKAGSEVSTNES